MGHLCGSSSESRSLVIQIQMVVQWINLIHFITNKLNLMRIAMAMSALIVWGFSIVDLVNTYKTPIVIFYLTWCEGFLLGS